MQIEIKKIIKEHLRWLSNIEYGKQANFSNLDLSNQNLSGLYLQSALFVNCNLSNVIMRGSDFSYCDFTNANLTNIDARLANFSYSNFTGAKIQESNLFGSNLQNTNFTNTNLENTNFIRAMLQNSDFSEVENISNIELKKANLVGSNIFDDNKNISFVGAILSEMCDITNNTNKRFCFYNADKCNCIHAQNIDSSKKKDC